MVASARRSVLVVVPFVKYAEAVWLCEQMRPGVEIMTLACVDPAAVGASVLDISALKYLSEATDSAKLIALSSLHAKVFVADDTAAIVTSGNLTRSALDRNIEYGVLFHEPRHVRTVRTDMLSFARLGSRVDARLLATLLPLEAELRRVHADVAGSPEPACKRRFDEVMQRAKPVFASAHVGQRSAHAVFGDAIRFVLSDGPRDTKVIQREVRQLLSALCDDNEYFFIRGERYGKAWMRRLRHAQQHLKKQGIVRYDRRTKTWALVYQ